jgi:hypothetical protein
MYVCTRLGAILAQALKAPALLPFVQVTVQVGVTACGCASVVSYAPLAPKIGTQAWGLSLTWTEWLAIAALICIGIGFILGACVTGLLARTQVRPTTKKRKAFSPLREGFVFKNY